MSSPINDNIIKIIVQAGAIGIALLTIYLLYSVSTNHIQHSTAALIKLESSIQQSIETDKEQTEVLRDLKLLIQTRIK